MRRRVAGMEVPPSELTCRLSRLAAVGDIGGPRRVACLRGHYAEGGH